MSKGGRPMIEGVVRYANDRINHRETQKLISQLGKGDPNDSAPPSPRILRERQMFNAKCFKGGNQAQHAGDAIGQLWLVGLIDIKGHDETKLLAAARMWWRGREAFYKGLDYKTARFERESRSSSHTTKLSKLEKAYERYESLLGAAEAYDADVLHDLMQPRVDGVPCMWAARLVQTEVLKHFILRLTVLACDADYGRLEAAKRALLAMAGREARLGGGEEREAA
jgi:hypothetical protein